jgi:uncharacterized DUF497 family protein
MWRVAVVDVESRVKRITADEAAEVLWNEFRALRDRDYDDRYLLLGRTDGGRPLELVAIARGKKRLRIITGWPL